MKKVTNIKEYDNEGKLIRETTTTEEFEDNKNVIYPFYLSYPNYPTFPYQDNIYYKTPNDLNAYTTKVTC